eukprot:gene26677-30146_t
MICLLSVAIDFAEITLLNFLAAEDIVRLDSALNNRSLRSLYRKALKRRVIDVAKIRGLNACLLNWLCQENTMLYKMKICSDVPIDKVLQNISCLREVKNLSLYGCAHFTEDTFVQLFHSIHSLIKIDLSRAGSLTDAAVEALARNHPQLDAIYISKCTLLTDQSVKALTSRCPSLQDWDLEGCTGLTRASLESLKRMRFVLRHLNICGCSGID